MKKGREEKKNFSKVLPNNQIITACCLELQIQEMTMNKKLTTIGLISSLLSNRQLRVVLDGKSSQEYLVNAGVPQGSILPPTIFLIYITDLLDVIYIAVYADDTNLYSKCNQAYLNCSNNQKLASELGSDLRDTMDWGRKLFVDCNTGKTQLVSFKWCNNTGTIDVKMAASVTEEKSSFKMLGLTFSSKLDWGSYIISIPKTASKKILALICSMKFLSPEVALYLDKTTIQPCMEYCCHVWAGTIILLNPMCI